MTRVRSAGLVLACLMMLSCAKLGCRGCDHDAVAVLSDVKGVTERDLAATQLTWQPAQVGANFSLGDGLRTHHDAEAVLRMSGGTQVRVESDTTIRFKANPGSASAPGIDVSVGNAIIQTGDSAFQIATEMGLAIIAAGTRLRVGKAERGQRYEVMLGRASFPNASGSPVDLAPGQSLEVDIGMVRLSVPDAGTKPAAAQPNAKSPDAGTPSKAEETFLDTEQDKTRIASADHADVVVDPGNFVSIYDPKPPTSIGFTFPEVCAHGGVVRIGTGKRTRSVHSQTQANIALPVGRHHYSITCTEPGGKQGPVVKSGDIRVVRNDGVDRLPKTAPSNMIDLDGRRYTIMFQNLLPGLQVRWPNAPQAAGYVLRADLAQGKSSDASANRTSATPVFTFKSGEIPEGKNQLSIALRDEPARHSPVTEVLVKFDNAAAVASVPKPAARGFAPEAEIVVEGVALPDSNVSVNGKALPLDAQQRFSARVPFDQTARALAIRIDHRRTGVRYYVRRPLQAR